MLFATLWYTYVKNPNFYLITIKKVAIISFCIRVYRIGVYLNDLWNKSLLFCSFSDCVKAKYVILRSLWKAKKTAYKIRTRKYEYECPKTSVNSSFSTIIGHVRGQDTSEQLPRQDRQGQQQQLSDCHNSRPSLQMHAQIDRPHWLWKPCGRTHIQRPNSWASQRRRTTMMMDEWWWLQQQDIRHVGYGFIWGRYSVLFCFFFH